MDHWSATGSSGRVYSFAVHRLDTPLPPVPSLFVLGYHHPKGHVAGNTVDPAYLGLARDLASELAACLAERRDCLKYEMCNCVCVLEGYEPDQYPAILHDLAQALRLPCGHDQPHSGKDSAL